MEITITCKDPINPKRKIKRTFTIFNSEQEESWFKKIFHMTLNRSIFIWPVKAEFELEGVKYEQNIFVSISTQSGETSNRINNRPGPISNTNVIIQPEKKRNWFTKLFKR